MTRRAFGSSRRRPGWTRWPKRRAAALAFRWQNNAEELMRLAEEGGSANVITKIGSSFLYDLVPWHWNPHAFDFDLVVVANHAPRCRPAILVVAARIAGVRPNETFIEALVKPGVILLLVVSIRPGME